MIFIQLSSTVMADGFTPPCCEDGADDNTFSNFFIIGSLIAIFLVIYLIIRMLLKKNYPQNRDNEFPK
jgi:hypothetical protein